MRLAVRSLVGAAAPVLVVAGLAPALAGCSSSGRPATAQANYVSGDGTVTQLAPSRRKPAPPLAGTTLDGTRFDLADQRGSVVVVNVWGSWCPPCRAEAPALERVHAATRSRGVQFVGIDVRESSADNGRAFERRYGIGYPSVQDTDGGLLLGFRGTLPPDAIPATLVIDRKGRVAARVLGQARETTLRDLVDAVVAEAP